jgi:hypothetical protein
VERVHGGGVKALSSKNTFRGPKAYRKQQGLLIWELAL